MKFKPKKWKIVLATILILLIVLNPSLKDFNEHNGDKDGKKLFNFLIASVYQDGSDQYIGFLLNFVQVNQK